MKEGLTTIVLHIIFSTGKNGRGASRCGRRERLIRLEEVAQIHRRVSWSWRTNGPYSCPNLSCELQLWIITLKSNENKWHPFPLAKPLYINILIWTLKWLIFWSVCSMWANCEITWLKFLPQIRFCHSGQKSLTLSLPGSTCKMRTTALSSFISSV